MGRIPAVRSWLMGSGDILTRLATEDFGHASKARLDHATLVTVQNSTSGYFGAGDQGVGFASVGLRTAHGRNRKSFGQGDNLLVPELLWARELRGRDWRRSAEMGVEVVVSVKLPSGEVAVGTAVEAVNRNAFSSSHKVWRGTTGADGTLTWPNLDKGTLGDHYDFRATYEDPNGVRWVGEASDRINSPRRIRITLRKA